MNHPRTAWLLLWAIIAVGGAPLYGGEIVPADLDGYRTHVAPLLEKYCIDCHGGDEPEGKFSLEQIDADLLSGSDVEAWRMIDDQVRFGDMPPSDADQPSAGQRQILLDWIRQELLKTQLPGVVADEKLLLPQFGNYVDHHALFDQRRSHVTPAPPRIWRLRPDIYSSLAGRLAERPTGLSNALNLLDGSDFKDYSTLYFLDEASTQQLLGNAKIIAATQLGPTSRDAVFKRLVSDAGPPDQATVKSAIEAAFRRALSRGPTSEEKARFANFYHQSAEIGGYKTAAKAMLTAVILQPEFVFRQELGDGPPDKFGRVRLSQREIAYALSYALSDSPLGEFTSAADQQKLATSEQVAAAVGRQLKDDSFAHDKNPRLIQFFREYFNYPFANEVFKDPPEGGTHSPGELVADLEITLREILKRDEQVLAQLLTTREYYVGVQYGRKQTANQLIPRPDKSRKYATAFSLPLDWKWSSHLQPVSFAAAALISGLTNVVTISSAAGIRDFDICFTGLGLKKGKHHTGHGGSQNGMDWAETYDMIRRFHFDLIARLAKKLDAVPEGDGTMLDNTVIVYLSDGAEGHHSRCWEWPFVMLGNAGGKLKTGRYVDYPGYGQLGHRITGNLYTTFLNLAGSSAERFGMADPNLKDLDQTGPLTELLARK